MRVIQLAICGLIQLSVLTSVYSFAGNKADSMKVAARHQRDSVLSDTYYALARYYFQVEHLPDSMIKYAQLAAQVANQHKLTARVMMSKKALGLAYTEARQFERAEGAYAEAMAIAEQTRNTQEIIAINNKLGYLFGVANDLTKSAYYYLKTAKEYEQLGDFKNLAYTYKNVVVIFTLQDQPEKIIEYTDKALLLIPKMNKDSDAGFIVDVYSNAAQHYFLVGEKDNNSEYIGKAKQYADSCLQVATRHKITSGLADAFYIIGFDQLKNKKYNQSISTLYQSLAFRESIPERSVFNIYTALAEASLALGDYQKSQRFIDSCRALSSSKQLDGPMILAEVEYHLYRKMNRSEAALDAYERFTKLREEFLNVERNKAVNDLEVKYQTELKEARIEELSQQAKIDSLQIRSLIAVVVVVSLVIIIVVFFYRQSVIKNKLRTMEVEQRLNRARINPHFFFNALASLQQYALRQTDGVSLASSLSRFGNVMRATLESTYQEYITLEREIAFLTEYLSIQVIRHPKAFQFSITHDQELEIDAVLMPPMIIQPFVENSIEHGLAGIDYEGQIAISFSQTSNELVVKVTDNGKGFLRQEDKSNEHISRATEIINDRLYLLNKKEKSNARYAVATASNGSGVVVSIYLPLIYKK